MKKLFLILQSWQSSIVKLCCQWERQVKISRHFSTYVSEKTMNKIILTIVMSFITNGTIDAMFVNDTTQPAVILYGRQANITIPPKTTRKNFLPPAAKDVNKIIRYWAHNRWNETAFFNVQGKIVTISDAGLTITQNPNPES